MKKILKYYLFYIFIFAILLFAIKKPFEKESGPSARQNYQDLQGRKKDRVALVESAEEAIMARLDLIGNARESIDISYYTLIHGNSTNIMLGSIVDAADRGVEVRVLLDGMFHNLTRELKDAIYGFESHTNINLKFYETFNLLTPWTWNNRLHDKIIIADEKLALIGGRNIGDKYFLQEVMEEQFVKDRDVIIFSEDSSSDSPSVIKDMKAYYNRLWNYKHSKSPVGKLTSKQEAKGEVFNQKLKQGYIDFKNKYLQETQAINWHEETVPTESIKFVYNPIGRMNQDPWCLRELLHLASEAKRGIFIQSPYVIPSRSMRSKVKEFDIDLMKVSILTNSMASSPNPFAIAGYVHHRKDIIDSGIEVYEYQGPESIHAKTYIFDDAISVIGSFNFDARSSYINTESMVVISSLEFTEKLKKNIHVDLKKSLIVDKDYSYIIEDRYVVEGDVSVFKKVLIGFLSKIIFFFEHLL